MSKIYIANFKSYLNFNQEVDYFKSNLQELRELAKDNSLIFCPSFVSLSALKDFKINLGAQNCGFSGAYTGEVSVESLSELGVKYCIVGHSERRNCETQEFIAQKIELLLANNITPILCVSDPGFAFSYAGQEIVIAYEPVWAIGTGVTPEPEDLEKTLKSIREIVGKDATILYGGSVSSKNAKIFKQIKEIDGFLIGKASTDFQELKKIVLS